MRLAVFRTVYREEWSVYPVNDLQALIAALAAAKKRQPLKKVAMPYGLGTNEAGPQVETSYPPNAWPSDGDHD